MSIAVSSAALFLFPSLLAFAASSDLLTMRISNRLVLAMAAAFFVVAIAIGMPLEQLAMHVFCAFVVLAVAFFLFAMNWIGGGDAKLAAATTLWLGFGSTVSYLLYTAIFGGVLTLLILSLRRIPVNPVITRFDWLERLHNHKSGVPYGIAMAAAGILVYSNSAIFEQLTA